MATGELLPYPKFKGESSTGVALSGGKLYAYSAGTTTPKDTYTTYDLGVANTNPVILDTNGEAVVYASGSYKFVLKDSDDVVQWTMDNVPATPYSAFVSTLVDAATAAAFMTALGISVYMQSLLDDASEAAFKATANLEAGTDIQAYSALLLAIAALTPTDGNIVVGDGATWVAESGATARASLGLTTLLPRGYIAGLQISNNGADDDQDIDIAVGECRDSTNAVDLVLAAGLTKKLDAVFAAGDDAGGLFNGTAIPATDDTWYHMFVIKKDSDGTIDFGFSTEVDASDIPAGYTYFRRVGSILTDGFGADIYGFTQIGDAFLWDNPKESVDEGNVDQTTAALKTMDVPTDVKVKALLNVKLDDNALSMTYLSSPDANDEAPNEDAAPLASITVINTGEPTMSYMEVYTNESSQIRVRGDNATVEEFDITTLGWEDRRGRDD